MKLLLVEDEPSFIISLFRALAPDYDIDMTRSGMTALRKIEQKNYDAVLLDLHLPDIHGSKVCEYLRAHGITTPILVISGEKSIASKVALLEAGATDYLTKPCSLAELKARIHVAIQHKSDSVKPVRFAYGDLELHTATRLVRRQNQVINLRPKEFTILECLLVHAELVVTREILADYAWPNEETDTNTLDVHIKYLRDKIDRPFDTHLIKTVHGVGYKLELSREVARRYLTAGSRHEASMAKLPL
jgi:DNA-binding response OmpR family regulator